MRYRQLFFHPTGELPMKRIHVLLAILAATGLLITGCGGGGGGSGGGGGDTTPTTSLSGRILDTSGDPVEGATVSVSTNTSRVTITRTTDQNGSYNLPGVPIGVSLTITVSKTGMPDRVLSGLVIGSEAGDTAGLDIVVDSEFPPAGSTLSITLANGLPLPKDIYANEETWCKIIVKNAYGDTIHPTRDSDWMASVIVTGGAVGAVSASDPSLFKVVGMQVGAQAKITALLTREDGTLAITTAVVNVKDFELPPGPPL